MLALLALGGAHLTGVHLLFGHPVGGWPAIVVSPMLFAGIPMISLGIVGEYVEAAVGGRA